MCYQRSLIFSKPWFQIALVILLAIFLTTAPQAKVQAQTAGCPDNCPGDFDGDGRRNLVDLIIFATEYWLVDCPVELPVYQVVSAGISAPQADDLADALNIIPFDLKLADGVGIYMDTAEFQEVPTLPVTDSNIILVLTAESTDDDGPLAFEAFDYSAISDIVVVDDANALFITQTALATAGLTPVNGAPDVSHSILEIVETDGTPIVQNMMLDTHVFYDLSLSDVPLIGPGAKINMTYAPDGHVTQLLYSMYELTPGESVPIISPDEAILRCEAAYPDLNVVSVDPELVYYAPPLSLQTVSKIIPCYECGGTANLPNGEVIHLLRRLIPATDETNLVPSVSLGLTVDTCRVTAVANVTGGFPPYSYGWSSSSTDLSGYSGAVIQYSIAPEDPDKAPTILAQGETVSLFVTDGNGMQATAVSTIAQDLSACAGQGPAALSQFAVQVGGVIDYGIERAVSDLGGPEQANYKARMDVEVFRRFNFTGLSSWEADFKDVSLDHKYNDNVDQTLYIGHGNGGGFLFESSVDDGSILYTDVVGDWGNNDEEWLALLSCQVLKASHDGKTWYQRWGPPFAGLHLLLGYQTNASAGTNTPWQFARWQLGVPFGAVTWVLPVRSAWFVAKKFEQPNDREAVVMGVWGPGGVISGLYDYFHGKGSVG
ncbi:MAG: hypothetical protein IID32_00065, partial [Planctomycetes bacterium]|nr:hypothetical protein [Planctomycetota bacterium]